jgi:hypothetical protein
MSSLLTSKAWPFKPCMVICSSLCWLVSSACGSFTHRQIDAAPSTRSHMQRWVPPWLLKGQCSSNVSTQLCSTGKYRCWLSIPSMCQVHRNGLSMQSQVPQHQWCLEAREKGKFLVFTLDLLNQNLWEEGWQSGFPCGALQPKNTGL